MTLSAGTHLGPYEILSPLGAGGMGEVYRARDVRLKRDVAVKVLPASFATDPDRLRRFEHEAQAAGSLNHPNITVVYDIGGHDGAPYVVQELLEGETLRAELAAGRLSPRKAIDYALQIAHGLAAAHDKGIVHRDLKPDNLFVTREGRVKILDFGLAKLTQTEAGSGPQTDLPTATAGTEPGVVMGTLGYISPEQIKGKPADSRSDIFSFGAILYEMLSGKRAFQADSAGETMAAILREDPPDLSVTNQSISPGLERVVRHCIEKSPERRFQSAHDLAFDLEALSGTSATGIGAVAAAAGRPAPRIGRLWLAGLAVAALAAGAVLDHLLWRPATLSPPTYRRLTFGRGPVDSARFAPDGNTVIYSASWDGAPVAELYSVRVESPESLRLNLADRWVEAISRTGEMLVLNRSQFSGYPAMGTLSQAPMSGSAPRELLEDVAGADWSPNGASLAVVRAPQFRYRLEFPAGKVLYETTGSISNPRVSPKGDAVAFLDHPVFGDDRGSVAIIDLAGKKKTLSEGFESMRGLAWSASGDEIWFTARRAGIRGSLYAVTPAGRERAVLTTPERLRLNDIFRDGRVLLIQENVRVGFFALLPGEARERDLSGLEISEIPRLSEDAKTVVFTEQGETGGPGYSVYQRKLDGSAAVRLGEGQGVATSSDGKWVLTCRLRTTPATFVLLPTGAGQPRTFPKDGIDRSAAVSFAAFLPDGKRIAFNGHETGRPSRVFVQDLAGGAARPVTPEGVTAWLVSPDGKLLLTQTAGQAFALALLEGGPSEPIRGLEPTDNPLRWAADGRSLFFASSKDLFPARVYRLDLATGRRELWKEFMPGDPTGIVGINPVSISADGQTILFAYGHRLSDLYLAEGLR